MGISCLFQTALHAYDSLPPSLSRGTCTRGYSTGHSSAHRGFQRRCRALASENGKPSGMGETAAHGKQMDERRSTDIHEERRINSFETKGHLSRKDQKIGSAISLFGCAWRANGRKAVTRQAWKERRETLLQPKGHAFPQRPKIRVCVFTSGRASV